MNGKLCPDVLYSLQLNELAIFITKKGVTYGMVRYNEVESKNIRNYQTYPKILNKKISEVSRLDINLINAEIRKENCIEEEFDPAPGVINFYSQGLNEDTRNLRAVKQLRIKNIYPNIDWLIKVDPVNGIKEDYIVWPGGDVKNICMEFNGASSIKLSDEKKYIHITTPLESITIGKLTCFTTDNTIVPAFYDLNKNLCSIKVGSYANEKPLIIDPFVNLERVWATYFGGINGFFQNDDDIINSCKIDLVGSHCYFVGASSTIAFPPLWPNGSAYCTSNLNFLPSIDAFIFQTDLQGVRQWCTYVFSTEADVANSVTTDNFGNVYMVGTSNSNTNPLSGTLGFPLVTPNPCNNCFTQGLNACFPPLFSQMSDGFITKFDASGIMVWSTMFGSSLPCLQNSDNIYDVACNSSGDVFICGSNHNTVGGNFKFQQFGSGYFNNTYPLGTIGFVAWFDGSTYELRWSTFTPNFENKSITVDANDNIYVTGYGAGNPYWSFLPTASALFPNAYAHLPFGTSVLGTPDIDGTIFAFDANTNPAWWTYFGTDLGMDHITSCDYGEGDQMFYISGYTEYNALTPKIFPFLNPGAAYFDDTYYNTGVLPEKHGWLARFNPDCSQNWATLFAGNGHDEAIAINSNAGGNVLLTGNTEGPSNGQVYFPLRNPAVSPAFYFEDKNDNFTNAYIAMFTNEGELDWSTYYGVLATSEHATDIQVDDIYVLWSGYAKNNNNTISNVSTDQETAGSWLQLPGTATQQFDGMIAKFNGSSIVRLSNLPLIPKSNIIFNEAVSHSGLKLSADEKIDFLLITDISGKTILSKKILSQADLNFIPNSLSAGYYFLKIVTQSGSATTKVFIK